jgi:predicted TIM-barrel fold metal-dependent hydrolase
MGLRGGDLAFKRMTPPLYTHEWYPLWEAAAECRFPISFHSTGFKALRAPDTPEMEKKYFTQWRLVRSALFQLDTMEVLVSLLASGACEKYPDFNFVLGESGVTWLPSVFDRLDTEYADRARSLNFKLPHDLRAAASYRILPHFTRPLHNGDAIVMATQGAHHDGERMSREVDKVINDDLSSFSDRSRTLLQ